MLTGLEAIFFYLFAFIAVAAAFMVIAARKLLPAPALDLNGVEAPDGLTGKVLLLGFGRFGQMVSQAFLARGLDVTIIDRDPDRIRNAAPFGFKVYYGDATNLDVLRASGAGTAKALAVCIDDETAIDKAVELCRSAFPNAGLLVRAYDRGHALRLAEAEVDVMVRETLESAFVFGREALEYLGLSPAEAEETIADIRRRDAERFCLEQTSGIYAGAALLHGNGPTPEPLTQPRRTAEPLNREADALTARGETRPD